MNGGGLMRRRGAGAAPRRLCWAARATQLLSLLLLIACEAPADRTLEIEVSHKDLSESSGLASSPARRGVWFTHNDSGGDPELFSFTLDGDTVERHKVKGAQAVDWEDMAAGPCPAEAGGDCLYIGDIGDNRRRRDTVQVYAVSVPGAGNPSEVVASWNLVYPDGEQNAETLLVDPRSGAVYIITKVDSGNPGVYRLPEKPGRGTLQPVAQLSFNGDSPSGRRTTGGDWHPDGSRIVVRTYSAAWEWRVDYADPEAHWQRAPRRIALPPEKQGEAIAYDPRGGLLTTSEGKPMQVRRTLP
jgi:hypothetical protein